MLHREDCLIIAGHRRSSLDRSGVHVTSGALWEPNHTKEADNLFPITSNDVMISAVT